MAFNRVVEVEEERNRGGINSGARAIRMGYWIGLEGEKELQNTSWVSDLYNC